MAPGSSDIREIYERQTSDGEGASHLSSQLKRLLIRSGNPRSCIDGHIIAVKDNICSLEEPTSCASAILQGFRSPFSATVVDKLIAAGALITGKTNLDEFGMGYAVRWHETTHLMTDACKHIFYQFYFRPCQKYR